MVALTGGPEGDALIRRAARIAARSAGGDLIAVHVSRSDGVAGAGPAGLESQRLLVESLGGTYHSLVGEDVPRAHCSTSRAASTRRRSCWAPRAGGRGRRHLPGRAPGRR